MARLVKAGESTAARRRVYFHLVGTDGMTPDVDEAGGQPQASTDGAAWTNTGIGTLAHTGNGRYYADLTAGAVAAAGAHIETRYGTGDGVEVPGDSVDVVAFDPAAPAPPDVDGLSWDDLMAAMMAVLVNKAAPSGNTVSFKLRDGTTEKVLITYGGQDGERTGSTIS